MRLQIASVAMLAALAIGSQSSQAADQIGSAVKIQNRVTGAIDTTVRTLATGDGVQQNEAIEAAADGLGELVLKDNSKLAVGPGARVVLDKFVYDPAKSTGTVGIDLLKGAFRFVTGIADKTGYVLRTPVASITVRGTVFDVYVDGATGATLLLLHEGSVSVCNKANQCSELSNPCGVVAVPSSGTPSSIPGWDRVPADRRVDFATAFPFVVNPPSIDPVGRFTRVAVESGTCPKPPTPPGVQFAAAPSTPPSPPQAPEPQQPSEPQTVEPQQPVTPTWTSIYAGVTIGRGSSSDYTPVRCNDPTGIFDTVFNTPNCRYPIESGALETRYDTDPRGVIGGATIGFNVAVGGLVFGVEGDVSKSDISGTDTEFKNVPPTSPGTRTVTQSLEWFSTVRGRIGFTQGNLLLYGTGGLAIGQSDYSYSAEYSGGVAFANVADTRTSIGWTAGLGAELGLGLVSIKFEYLYYDLGDESLSAQFFTAGPALTPVTFDPTFENTGHIVRIGTNIKLTTD